MPTYDYTCPTCETKFDLRVAIADADLPVLCPTCGSNVEREFVPRSTPVYFHGRGWSRVDKNYPNDGS